MFFTVLCSSAPFSVIRGFVARRQFKKVQLAAEQQAKVVAALLRQVPLPTQGIYQRLKAMNEEDEKRPKGVLLLHVGHDCVVRRHGHLLS